jgi:hypothetical protein
VSEDLTGLDSSSLVSAGLSLLLRQIPIAAVVPGIVPLTGTLADSLRLRFHPCKRFPVLFGVSGFFPSFVETYNTLKELSLQGQFLDIYLLQQ